MLRARNKVERTR